MLLTINSRNDAVAPQDEHKAPFALRGNGLAGELHPVWRQGSLRALDAPAQALGTLTPIILSRVTSFASSASLRPSVPAGRFGSTR